MKGAHLSDDRHLLAMQIRWWTACEDTFEEISASATEGNFLVAYLLCSPLPSSCHSIKFSAHIDGIIAVSLSLFFFFLKRFSPSVLTHGLERDQYCDLGLLICPLVIWHAAKVSFGEHAEAQSPQR